MRSEHQVFELEIAMEHAATGDEKRGKIRKEGGGLKLVPARTNSCPGWLPASDTLASIAIFGTSASAVPPTRQRAMSSPVDVIDGGQKLGHEVTAFFLIQCAFPLHQCEKLLLAQLKEDDVLVASARRAKDRDYVIVRNLFCDRHLPFDSFQRHLAQGDALGRHIPEGGRLNGV
eukprot:scaffold193686_cov35-Tisochrysis_lutea.AAC.1